MAAGKYTHRIPVDISDLDILNEPHSYNREHTHFMLKGFLTPLTWSEIFQDIACILWAYFKILWSGILIYSKLSYSILLNIFLFLCCCQQMMRQLIAAELIC